MVERCNCDASCGENRYHDKGEPGCMYYGVAEDKPIPTLQLEPKRVKTKAKTEGKSYTLEGFVIVPPVNSWDDPSVVIPHMSYRKFGKTVVEAWCHHTQLPHTYVDWSKHIQYWHDRGYMPKKATLTIES